MPERGESILINGNQAITFGVLAAGCKFYSAYPMTPSTSLTNYLASKMMDAEIVVEQADILGSPCTLAASLYHNIHNVPNNSAFHIVTLSNIPTKHDFIIKVGE